MWDKKLTKGQQREDLLVENIKSWMRFQLVERGKITKAEIWENIDIEVMWVKNFKFKKEDIIVVDEVWERTLKFHVKRKWEDKTGEWDKVIEFEFNKLLFVQRFEGITNLVNVVRNILQQTQDRASSILD